MPNNVLTLETDRLVLRPLKSDDAPRIQEIFPHWDIVKLMADHIPWPYPEDGARHFVDTIALPAMERGEEYDWAICLKDNPQQLIGMIALYPNRDNDHRGFWLGLAYQRQGYMKEACAAVNDFAFFTLNMPELILNNAELNLGSHSLKEKYGATIVQTNEDVPYVGGRFRQIIWSLKREDWKKFRPSL